MTDLQTPFDVSVVMATIVRPTIALALGSIYTQQFKGRIQVLIGIDHCEGERSMLDCLIAEKPDNVAVTVLELGYSTSRRHGGLYPSSCGGALKTILSYAANSRYVTYLDDDNWYAPDHLASLLSAVAGKDWAFSLRTFVDAETDELLCPDTWESVGPGRGVYAKSEGGFVDTNCFLIDKIACPDIFHEWALTHYEGGTGGDRQIFRRLRWRPYGKTGHTLYYRLHLSTYDPRLMAILEVARQKESRYQPRTEIAPSPSPDA